MSNITVLVSDTHIGESVKLPNNRYSIKIARNRLCYLAEMVARYRTDQSGLNVLFGGDTILGQLRPSAKEIAEVDVVEQVSVCAELYAEFVRKCEAEFGSVRAWGVCGNHGRLNKPGVDGHLVNHDMSVYRMTNMILGREVIKLPTQEYAAIKIGSKRLVLTHGDQVKSQLGFPQYGLSRLLNNLYATYKGELDILCCGHFHRFAVDSNCNRWFVANGSLVGPDDFANKFGLSNGASQTILRFDDHSDSLEINSVSLAHIQR